MPDKIGFFGLQKTEDGNGYIGALLVTDVVTPKSWTQNDQSLGDDLGGHLSLLPL